uniref:Uncharacterized protein n=1 Tax=Tanacetum cinerariifolium TaxID=118510 RepID=A0A6L2LQ68_TANCI|nr:hypothetical protein [Tanacetum cinerariifolium]
MPKYTIKSTDKAALKEYDQTSALYQTMHENKSFNRNHVYHRLYHVLLEALIEDKNAMDKGVANIIKGHKRKHDDVDHDHDHDDDGDGDDDDEDPLARPNQEGDRYPFNLSKPLPLQDHPGRLTIVADYFFNNDIECLNLLIQREHTLRQSQRKKARYKIVCIEDMIPTLWSTIMHAYDKDAARGSSIRAKGSVSVKKLHGYGHLEEVVVKRADRQLCKFKECDFVDLYLNNIEDMLLFAV